MFDYHCKQTLWRSHSNKPPPVGYIVEQPPDHAHSIKKQQHWIVWKCLHQMESWVAGYWQNCKSKGVPICSFAFFPHMSFPRSLKSNLILLPSIFIFFPLICPVLGTAVCAQLSHASRTHFCTSSAFSNVIICSMSAISPSFQLHLQWSALLWQWSSIAALQKPESREPRLWPLERVHINLRPCRSDVSFEHHVLSLCCTPQEICPVMTRTGKEHLCTYAHGH